MQEAPVQRALQPLPVAQQIRLFPGTSDSAVLYITYTPHYLFGCHFKHVDLYHIDSEFPDDSFGDMVVHIAGYPVARKAVLLDALPEGCTAQVARATIPTIPRA